MGNKKNIDQLREQGWEDMTGLLDTHMPTRKRRFAGLWYPLAGAAAIALLLIITWPRLSVKDGTSSSSMVTTPEPHTEQHIGQSESPDAADSGSDHLAAELSAPTEVHPAQNSKTEGLETRNDTKIPTTSFSVADNPPSAPDQENQTRISGRQNQDQKSLSSKPTPPLSYSDDQTVTSLIKHGPIVALLENVNRYVSTIDPTLSAGISPTSVTIQPTPGKLQVAVFSEMMWSISDQFGFLNAGPSISFKKDKWTLGLSGGLAIPIPKQKTFDDSNINFSNQYNFHQVLSKEYFDLATAANPQLVYYENYSMNPGFKFDVFGMVQISPKWNFIVDVGRIGYRWDFSQKAVPNQSMAARTDLTNLKNEMWYGGASIGYDIGNRWSIHGGIRMINPGDPTNLGIMPALRVGFGF